MPGLGLGLFTLGVMGGGAVDPNTAFLSSLPTGAVGVWVMDQYVAPTGGRQVVPNMLSSVPASANLFGLSRRQFNRTQFWTKFNTTIADDAVADPAGLTQASTFLGTTSNWRIFPAGTGNIPAGTYTIAANVRRNTGTDQPFAFTSDNTSTRSSVNVATSAWQRFSYTFVRGSTAGIQTIGICSSDGATAADIQVCDLELYSGSADLGPQTLAGHLYTGVTTADSQPTYSSGALNFSSSKLGFIQFTDTTTIQNATIATVARKAVIGNGSGFHASLSRVNGHTTLTSAMEVSRNPASMAAAAYAGGMINLWELFNQGWHVFTHRQQTSDNRRDLFIDGCKLVGVTSAPSSVDCRDLGVSYVNATSLTANYEIAAIILWNRALSDSEIR